MVAVAISVWQTVIFSVCALWRAVYITAATLISVAEMVAEYSPTRELRLLQAIAQNIRDFPMQLGGMYTFGNNSNEELEQDRTVPHPSWTDPFKKQCGDAQER